MSVEENISMRKVILIILIVCVFFPSFGCVTIDRQEMANLGDDTVYLPQFIDSKVKEELIQRFAQHWHDGDARAIERMFDFVAGEHLVDFLERWKSSAGDIVEWVYSHHQYIEPMDHQNLFQLHYFVRFEKDEGMVIFDICCSEESYKPIGFYVVGNKPPL